MAQTVTISVAEYESLLETRRQFLSLKQALLAGGVTTETLDVLVSGTCPPTPPDEESSSIDVRVTESTRDGASRSVPIPISRPRLPIARSSEASTVCHRVAYLPKSLGSSINSLLTPEYTEEGDVQEEMGSASGEQARHETRPAKRSLVISGLLPNATLYSLARVLKGGAILQMYIRPWKRCAHVSFVEPTAAENFLHYAQANGIKIGGRKVIAEWDNQQARMQPSFTSCIQSLGRTRNLVIRYVDPGITADGIRADLEHIHFLEIVDLFFTNGHAYISLNSIRAALTARTCMLSRMRYKRSQIDFYPDECDQPLPPVDIRLPYQSTAFKPAGLVHKNRFELLYDLSEESQKSSDGVKVS